ncbi:hypothetical protein ACCT30_24020, partial [Rhizobium ruizarguesonis]
MSPKSSRVSAYFSHLVSHLGSEKEVHCVAVAHMVPNTLEFAPALDDLMTLSGLLAKPKSVTRPEFKLLSKKFKTPKLSREWAEDPAAVVKILHGRLGLRKKRVVIVDIGGYFASSIDEISRRFDGTILGVMEGTENGVVKYENRAPY